MKKIEMVTPQDLVDEIKKLKEENAELRGHVAALKTTNTKQLDKLVQAELKEKAAVEAEAKKGKNGTPVNGTPLLKKAEV